MVQLPPLVTAEPATKRELDAGYAPTLKFLNGSRAERRSALLPQLSVTTASSLRPARVRPFAPAAAAAPPTLSPGSPLSPSADAATTHPLLSQLLRVPTPAASSELSQSLGEVSVAEAVEALGRTDAVEALLAQLNDVAHWAGASDDAAFADAVERCVQQTLGVSAVSVGAAEANAVALIDAEGGESHARATSRVNVVLPIPTSDCNAAAPTLFAVRQRRSPTDSSTTASDTRRSYRTCLLLRIQRRRGVLGLHVVNVRFEGGIRKSRQSLRGAALGSEGQQKKPGDVERLPWQGRTVQYQGLQPPSRRGRASTTEIGSVASCFLPAFNNAEVVVAGAGDGDASTVSCRPAKAPSWSSPVLCPDVTCRRGSAAPAKHSQRHLKSKSGLRQGNITRVAAYGAFIKRSASFVFFDPFRPEKTTPFNAQHRPVTYNAAIAFQAPL
ncbi:hypothetical protein LSCM4_03653 [Leishmania orientalis]|uniref:Uncharacterized protein n=1 Tax=Leishmania orientalis TaxID=2249476 RepID=A0A836H1P2_9TRYP|nr:hypothetical protein LSCM4_03653 [Leishmania orientalis]